MIGAQLMHRSCSMPSRPRGSPARFRVGRVSVYPHHGAWWAYYRDGGESITGRAPERRRTMGARQKLNRSYVNGSLLLASLVGWLAQSWLTFGLALAVL